jgi:hypothetical protein
MSMISFYAPGPNELFLENEQIDYPCTVSYLICMAISMYTATCEESQFLLNSGTITSPGYPTKYTANLCCAWNITAEENYFVQFDLYQYDLHLEDKCDVLRVYDGSCPSVDNDTLVTEFTGRVHLYSFNVIIMCS